MSEAPTLSPTQQSALRRVLDREATALGFDQIGIVSAHGHNDLQPRLAAFVKAGHHGTMEWMQDTLVRRSRPQSLWPGARSIIMLAMNYGPETNPLAALENSDRGTVSVYARHKDYHDVIKGRLKTLASKLLAGVRRLDVEAANATEAKVFVDTAPVMEKPLAARAGLGWQGKHTNLVSRTYGSWLFLGSIFTNLSLDPDTPDIDHCGSCRTCLDVCPTNAFPAPYQLDARRCISYLTIEHAGPIPVEHRKAMGNRIYGCDDCLAVCPWNKFAQQASEAKLAVPEGTDPTAQPALADLLDDDDAAFRQRFSGSPVKRVGRDRFIRNCLIAAGNSGEAALIPSVSEHLEAPNSVVRDAAEWALSELNHQKVTP
ncbi:MAG: tRNA epoxyqueuosine(34) reductase QueG [Pseudomonadota bacterium]